jgi:hypothetical protein
MRQFEMLLDCAAVWSLSANPVHYDIKTPITETTRTAFPHQSIIELVFSLFCSSCFFTRFSLNICSNNYVLSLLFLTPNRPHFILTAVVVWSQGECLLNPWEHPVLYAWWFSEMVYLPLELQPFLLAFNIVLRVTVCYTLLVRAASVRGWV